MVDDPPADARTTSRPPVGSDAAATAACTWASSVTSHTTACTVAPSAATGLDGAHRIVQAGLRAATDGDRRAGRGERLRTAQTDARPPPVTSAARPASAPSSPVIVAPRCRLCVTVDARRTGPGRGDRAGTAAAYGEVVSPPRSRPASAMSADRLTVVFDLGGVLVDWDPRHLYRRLIQDEAEMEWFLAEVCTPRVAPAPRRRAAARRRRGRAGGPASRAPRPDRGLGASLRRDVRRRPARHRRTCWPTSWRSGTPCTP